VLSAVLEIAAWAVGTGRGGSVREALSAALGTPDPETPTSSLDVLAEIDAVAIADPERVALYDPVLTAERLIASFDERERATLERVLDFDRSAPTLQELGERFGVT